MIGSFPRGKAPPGKETDTTSFLTFETEPVRKFHTSVTKNRLSPDIAHFQNNMMNLRKRKETRISDMGEQFRYFTICKR
jgi:hypothetical protein